MSRQGTAIVVGASISGLFAGRALADHFDHVVVIDKEGLDGGQEPRQAVPQGGHIHAILPPTSDALNRFVPELLANLVADGGHVFDSGEKFRMYIEGMPVAEGFTDQQMVGGTRPFFEKHLRDSVSETENLEIRTNTRFTGWTTDNERKRVTGVHMTDESGSTEVAADLVIDARGRASTLTRELVELGYDAPDTDIVRIGLGYTSRLYTYDGPDHDWNFLAINPTPPDDWAGAAMEKCENGKYILTMFGYFGDHAPADDAGFMDFARKLAAPDVAEFLEHAKPISEYRVYGTPESKFQRYDKMNRFPDRLLPIGDTICSLNPIYGQGMTKVAREVMHLADMLENLPSGQESMTGFCDRFRTSLPDVGAAWAWGLTNGGDLAFPQAEGDRPPLQKFMSWYMARLFRRSLTDLDTRKGIFNATMLIRKPSTLFRPRMILHALGF